MGMVGMENRNAKDVKIMYLDKFVIGERILDVGCGTGFYSYYLKNKGFEVISLDIYNLLRFNALEFVQGNAKFLPFKSKSFDAVVLFDVLEHIDDQFLVLSEIHRVCRKRLILSVPNADDGFLPECNLTFKHHKDKTHKREYTVDELRGTLEAAGFKLIHVSPENEITPFFIAKFFRPRLELFCKSIILVLKSMGLFRTLPRADIFAVADVSYETDKKGLSSLRQGTNRGIKSLKWLQCVESVDLSKQTRKL